MQIIGQPLSRINLLDTQTRFPIRQRRKEQKAPENRCQHHDTSDPASEEALLRNTFADWTACLRFLSKGSGFWVLRLDAEDEFDEGASDEAGCKMGGEVVV